MWSKKQHLCEICVGVLFQSLDISTFVSLFQSLAAPLSMPRDTPVRNHCTRGEGVRPIAHKPHPRIFYIPWEV